MSLTDTGVASRSQASGLLAWLAANPGQFVLLAGMLAALALLMLPVSLPLGPYYWDIAAYLDGAHRIASGQIPHVDFGSPFGALTLLLYGAADRLFPDAQPVLAAQYALLPLAAPAMALVLRDARGGAWTGLALAAPLMLFALAPYNGTNLEPLIPGVDAFGIYNRQAGLLCYLLIAALLFCRSGRVAAWVTGGLLAALLFIKITAFAGALGLLAFAVVTGRIKPRFALAALLGPMLAAGAGQCWGGLTGAYFASIAELSAHNSESVAGRVVAAILMNLTILLPVALLCALLGAREILRLWADDKRPEGWQGLVRQVRALFDSDCAWLVTVTLFGIAIEHQNSGSNQFIYLWPVLLHVLLKAQAEGQALRRLMAVLVLASALPTLVGTVQRGARIALVTLTYDRLDEPGLNALGHVLVRPEQLHEAQVRTRHSAAAREDYRALVTAGVNPWPPVESHPVAQAAYLVSLADALAGLARYEAENRVRLQRVAALDYFDPIALLLKREPVAGLPIVHDPARTMSPERVAKTVEALSAADGILVPRCRVSVQRHLILDGLDASLEGRRGHEITSCWSLYVR